MDKKKMRKMLYIYIAIMLVLVFSSRTLYNFSLPRVTAAMPQQGWINKELETRGVVEFSQTFNILATDSGWIDELFISAGDTIYSGAAVANYSTSNPANIESLQFTLERTAHQLAVLQTNRTNIQSNLQGLTAAEDFYQLEWAVADAQAAVEKQRAALADAQQTTLSQGNAPTAATTAAQREWNRLLLELQEAKATADIFDDYNYQNRITEAIITVERQASALQQAKNDLASAIATAGTAFDRHNYQNTIGAAQSAYTRAAEDYQTATHQYEDAIFSFHFLIMAGAGMLEIAAAENAVTAAERAVTTARRVRDDARTALNQANETMRHAESAFNAGNQATRAETIANAETRVNLAETALADATRDLDNAISALNRAKESAANAAQTRIANAQTALDDSEWAMQTAQNAAAENAEADLTTAKANLAQAYLNLERAETSLRLAQQAQTAQASDTRDTLQQSLQQADLDIAFANINLREAQLALAAALDFADTSTITAGLYGNGMEMGIVVDVNVREGQPVSRGDIIAVIGAKNNHFMLEITSTFADAGFVEIGDEPIILRSGSANVRGAVSDIRPASTGDGLTIRVNIETDQLTGGEYVRVRFTKQTGLHQMIVPNSAVFQGAMGQHYVWFLQSSPGTLGTEYRAVRVSVFIDDSDQLNTAISTGMGMIWNSPVITSHSRELSVNGRVSRMES